MFTSPDLKHVLLIDDDEVFTRVLARALSSRGFAVTAAHDAEQALALAHTEPVQFAVLDLKLGSDNGLTLIHQLKALRPNLRILLLTGYASIATAVEAIKRGADDYLAKPVDADAVVHAMLATQSIDKSQAAAPIDIALPRIPSPLKRLEWEHIHRMLGECDGNISETARRLGLHRRTLQRKLAKRPVREAE
jgi:two-component system response regulator RegA